MQEVYKCVTPHKNKKQKQRYRSFVNCLLKLSNLMYEFTKYVKSSQCVLGFRKSPTRNLVAYIGVVSNTSIFPALDVLLRAV